jgi:hypothetical protein
MRYTEESTAIFMVSLQTGGHIAPVPSTWISILPDSVTDYFVAWSGGQSSPLETSAEDQNDDSRWDFVTCIIEAQI